MEASCPKESRCIKIIDLVNKHLKPEARATIKEHLDIIDISGMSNLTFIVAHQSNLQAKIVIRFFMSKASDFEAESKIFR